MEEMLRKTAKELLESKKVGVVIGYGRSSLEGKATPIFVSSSNEVDKLIFTNYCYYNLVSYLKKPEVKALGKAAIVLKGCDLRAFNILISENQLKREDFIVIGVNCPGLADSEGNSLLAKCLNCQVKEPSGCDILIEGDGKLPKPSSAKTPSLDEELKKLEAMSPEERFRFWKSEFDKCIRCYACRQICPMCYCQSCICEKSQPQWVSTSPSSKGNMAWHIIRAFHLAGRCSGCQECARACPVGIRLDLLNKKLAQEIKDAFDFVAGIDSSNKPPLTTYKPDDKQDFIK